jgi:NTE family protein
MTKKICFFAVLVTFHLSFFGQKTWAQPGLENENERPKVGLVLSGGGAKGFAYIGLFKVLDEVNMPIDFIGGSSMGAITAALYSAGYSPEKMLELVREQDWQAVINDTQERKYISYEEKLFGDKYIYSIPIGEEGVSLSRSISSSFNIDMLLNNLFLPVAHITDFNELPIPFVCLGTDLLTGEAVVLNKGNLARAVRASMAIPAYFTPTLYDGRYLIDGGVVNNYPAEQVKAMGANIIIGGDVQAGLTTEIKKLNSITSILDQVVSYYRVEANEIGMKLTDVYINFPMPYGMMDFNHYDSIIAIGEKIARDHYDELKALADSLNALGGNLKTKPNLQDKDSIVIEKVIWPDITLKHRERYTGYFDDFLNKKSSLESLNEKLFLLNGTKTFDDLHTEFNAQKEGIYTLKIEAENNTRGSLSAGVHYDNIYHGSVLVNASLRNIRGGNSKFFADAVLSQYPRLYTLFIINNGVKPGFGLETDFYSLGFKQYEYGNSINNWHFNNFSFGTFMPLTVKNNFMFKLGFNYELFQFKQDVVVDPELDAFREFTDYGNVYLSFNHDSRDKVYFTQKGQLIEFKGKQVFPFSSKWKENFSHGTILYLKYNYHVKINEKLVFAPGLFAGYTFASRKKEELPGGDYSLGTKIPSVKHLFGFGGLNPSNYVENHISFTGIKFIENFGLYAGKISTLLQYNVYRKLYVSAMVDFGLNEMELTSFNNIEWLLGYGVKFSYESFVGPVEFSLMSSNIDSSLIGFINLGFWF